MKPQPHLSTQEVLAGLVERVTFQNTENGFCVLRAKARGHRDLVTVIGHAATIVAGEWITASGKWVNDRTHGQQFKSRFMLEQVGFGPGDHIVTHCEGGGRAALGAAAAVRAGFDDVRVYYLSFADWVRDEICPIVRD